MIDVKSNGAAAQVKCSMRSARHGIFSTYSPGLIVPQ
jgi:hypothetical protein